MAHAHDIGSQIVAPGGVIPQNQSGDGTINGATGIDRTGFHSAKLVLFVGAVTGTPTSFTVDCNLQESSDDGSADAYADIANSGVTQVTAASTIVEQDIDLADVEKWIRPSIDVAFTGGTSPTVDVTAMIILGGADELPATAN